MDPRLQPPPVTAQEEAYRFLLSRILTGECPGGTRLNLDEVAAAIGVSRMPVREAIRQLSAEGLVTVRPNRGAVVTELMPGDVVELFEMRGALEALAVRVALPRLDAEAFQDLDQLVGRMNRRRGNAAQWLRDHDEFHDYICRRSDRPRLVEQTRRLRRTIEPYLRVHVGVYDPPEMSGAEHSQLIEVFRSGDVERAERAMREHVDHGAAYVLAFLASARPRSGRAQPGPSSGVRIRGAAGRERTHP